MYIGIYAYTVRKWEQIHFRYTFRKCCDMLSFRLVNFSPEDAEMVADSFLPAHLYSTSVYTSNALN